MEQRKYLYVKLKGLPFDVTQADVLKFMSVIPTLTEQDLAFRYRDGGVKFSGLAFIRVDTQEDQTLALGQHKKYIDQRYVEVFASSETEFKSALHTRKGQTGKTIHYTLAGNPQNGFVKARGLPFDSTLEEIEEFFDGFEVVPGGVWRSYYRDRPDGQCFVVFKDGVVANEAVKLLNQKHLGKRYLELFVITVKDFQNFLWKNKSNLINDVTVQFDEKFTPPQPRRRQQRYDREPRSDYRSGGRGGYDRGQRGRRDRGYGDDRRSRYGEDRRGGGSYRREGGRGDQRQRRRAGYSPSKNDRTLLGKGFPYDVNKDDVKEFFGKDFYEDIEYVYFINSGGRFTGDCYIVFSTEKIANTARKDKHKHYLGKRYINLFSNAGQSSEDEDDY